MNFLKENWLYIFGPLILILISLALLILFSSDPSGPTEFQYDL